jgi:hypothetical protein
MRLSPRLGLPRFPVRLSPAAAGARTLPPAVPPPSLHAAPAGAAAGVAAGSLHPSPPGSLPVRSLSTAVAAAAAATSGSQAPPAVLVKVGRGKYAAFRRADAMKLNPYQLLEALQQDAAFAPSLAGVLLHDCAVQICVGTSPKQPSAAEAAAARLLVCTDTLGELAAGLAAAAPGSGTMLFVRVHLPRARGSNPARECCGSASMEHLRCVVARTLRPALTLLFARAPTPPPPLYRLRPAPACSGGRLRAVRRAA